MSKKPTLYYIIESPPCRVVMAVAKILNIDMDLKVVDLRNKEQMSPEYLKLNPFHKVPTFVDADGFVLSESRAIAKYLFESRRPDNQQFYPQDNLKRRAQIDRWLFYDCGTFFETNRKVMYDLIHLGQTNEDAIKNAKETMKTLDSVLATVGKGNFLVDNQFSLADISLYFSSNLFEFVPFYSMDDYPNIKVWYHKVAEELKQYDPEGVFPKAIESMKQFMAPFLKKQ